ncbi:unnamed protein product [Protopolystoma xenopodis]|uniref:Uncharacterized protein n=1 Tax=Protopolystoma xenopodis TaxID=117903 RepID=A0A448WHY1_9PLAT|nr:unnamed protein product [Protopolystoma xenopodis]
MYIFLIDGLFFFVSNRPLPSCINYVILFSPPVVRTGETCQIEVVSRQAQDTPLSVGPGLAASFTASQASLTTTGLSTNISNPSSLVGIGIVSNPGVGLLPLPGINILPPGSSGGQGVGGTSNYAVGIGTGGQVSSSNMPVLAVPVITTAAEMPVNIELADVQVLQASHQAVSYPSYF